MSWLNKTQATRLQNRVRSMRNDIVYNALPNRGEEKLQWLNDLSDVIEILNEYERTAEDG